MRNLLLQNPEHNTVLYERRPDAFNVRRQEAGVALNLERYETVLSLMNGPNRHAGTNILLELLRTHDAHFIPIDLPLPADLIPCAFTKGERKKFIENIRVN